MKLTGNLLVNPIWLLALLTTWVSALSVQEDSAKFSHVFAEDNTKALTEMQLRREQNRELRLQFLGALTEQLVKWFFNDIIPKDVMSRTKRSLNIAGKISFFDMYFHCLKSLI